jgi:hypothetical protein
VSLLLDHGHPDASAYPVGQVWDEASLVVERLNGLEATRAILVQMAVSSVLSKEAGAEFSKAIKRLND